jgi:hypothetical protein
MAEVIPFKDTVEATAWRIFEDNIRMAVDRFGYCEEVADWVVRDMKSRPFRFQFKETLSWDEVPAGVEKYLAECSEQIKAAHGALLGEWLVEIVKLECELWAAKFYSLRAGV